MFAIKRTFKSGKVAKNAIVYFEAKDKEEALKAFGVGGFWSGFRENVGFVAEEVGASPKKATVYNASSLIEERKKEEEERERWLNGE